AGAGGGRPGYRVRVPAAGPACPPLGARRRPGGGGAGRAAGRGAAPGEPGPPRRAAQARPRTTRPALGLAAGVLSAPLAAPAPRGRLGPGRGPAVVPAPAGGPR